MAERKYIDYAEFRDSGFLQEANRLFFHPHGLALEGRAAGGEPITAFALTEAGAAALHDLIAAARERALIPAELLDELEALFGEGKRYEPGEGYISGVWDCRDDPEGVIFGDDVEDKRAKADSVKAERARHARARADLFGISGDIEPVDWEHDES